MLIIIDCIILIRSCFKVTTINEWNNLLEVKWWIMNDVEETFVVEEMRSLLKK